MFSKPEVFLQDKVQNGNFHRGGRKRSFSHFNCTPASESPAARDCRAREREGRPRPKYNGCLSQQKAGSPEGFITHPALFIAMNNLDAH